MTTRAARLFGASRKTNAIRGAFISSCLAVCAFGQAIPLEVNVDDPRPLARAVEQLERVLGVPINYEDPRYENSADLADVTSAVARLAAPSTGVIIPRGGSFKVSLELPTTGRSATAADGSPALAALLRAYKAAGYANEYQSSLANGMLYAVPTRLLTTGGIISTESVLMTRINVPLQERSGADTLQFIQSAVSKASGYKIGLGAVPLGALVSTRVLIGANAEPARDVLARLFASIGQGQLSYHLYFDPRLRYYMLNVHPVQRAQTGVPPALGAQGQPDGINSHWTKKQ